MAHITCSWCGVNMGEGRFYEGFGVAMRNLESYNPNGSVLVASPCCQRPLHLKAKIVYTAIMATTNKTEDDWGVEFAK